MKHEILWVSLYAPYDKVSHAGGKIENYYIKKLQAEDDYQVYLISFFDKNEIDKLDISNYGIEGKLISREKWYRKIINIESTINVCNWSACSLQNFYFFNIISAIKEYKKIKGVPDLILLEWTPIILMQADIKRIFPGVPILGVEEDVQFLSYKRKMDFSNLFINKCRWKYLYERLVKLELNSINSIEKVCVNNSKDEMLLESYGIDSNKIFKWVPWFDNYSKVGFTENNDKLILFYGAMGRKENYLSAEWFIENCLSKLDKDFKFVIVGSNPPKRLLKYECDRVEITGFVEDVSLYFSRCMLFVAPLVLGAGVKIKILEGFSAGVPILTNHIGIEGIPAEDGIDFYLCESAEDYIDRINMLSNNPELRTRIGRNAKKFIADNYNIDVSFNRFKNLVDDMIIRNK